jgi:regulator of sigma E protease
MVRYPLIGYSYNGTNPQAVATLISIDTQDDPIIFTLDRNGKTVYATTTPNELKIASSTNPSATSNKPVVGITLTSLGTIKTSLALAPIQGAEYTWEVIKETAIGLFNLFKGLLTFSADLSQVSGPIGIAGAVGQATSQGIAAILSIAALISINLALVNLIPIPALDGGRLLFVILEAIIGRPLDPKWTYRVNAVGFTLLIILMIVISGHDIYTLIK